MVENDIDVGFLIKNAFKSIRHDLGYIVLYLLPVVVFLFFMVYMWFAFGDLPATLQNIQDPNEFFNTFKERLLPVFGVAIVFVISIIFVSAISVAGLIKKAEVQEKGKKISVSNAFSFGLKIFPRFFAAMVLGMIIIAGPFIGIVALMMVATLNNMTSLVCLSSALMVVIFIPWIYIVIRLSLYPYSCVIDNLGPIDCLRKSWQVSKGNVLLIFVTALILMIVSVAVMAPFIIINNITPSNPYIQIGYAIVYAIIGPLSTITFTLLYLRISKKKTESMEITQPVQNTNM